jgi:hypothetical protein
VQKKSSPGEQEKSQRLAGNRVVPCRSDRGNRAAQDRRPGRACTGVEQNEQNPWPRRPVPGAGPADRKTWAEVNQASSSRTDRGPALERELSSTHARETKRGRSKTAVKSGRDRSGKINRRWKRKQNARLGALPRRSRTRNQNKHSS